MDIAGEAEKAFVGLDDFGPEPLLKKMADKIVFGLKITDVADKESLDKFGNRQFGGLIEKKVEVVGHKAIAVDFNGIFFPVFFYFFGESGVVGVVFEDIPALVAAGINVIIITFSVMLVKRHRCN